MSRTIKIILYSIAGLAILLLIVTVTANILLKKKLESLINTGLPDHITSSYEELSIHTLDGSILLKNPTLTILNKENSVKHTFIKAENLTISDLSYWDYIFKNKIHVGKITLKNPNIAFYKDKVVAEKNTKDSDPQLDHSIFVDRLEVTHAKVAIFEKGKDSTRLYTKDLSIAMDRIVVDKKSLQQKIPLKYNNLKIEGDSLFVKTNAYDNFTVKDFSLRDNNIALKQVRFYTKYSKSELSRIIKVERDHYDLAIKSILIQNFDFGYNNENLFFAKSESVSLDTPNLDIYRDKLVADDESIKPLYSRLLRELPFHLTINSMKVNDGFLKYEEKVHEENKGGSIEFKNLEADISNLSNTYKSPEKTDIKINALFMDTAPLSVDWSFEVQNPQDHFVFKANLGKLDAEKMNLFTEPNLNVRLEGEANKTYFTIDGNNHNSTTDLKINYSDFRVTVLQKGGKKKNKLLSAVVNIFVSKNSESKQEKFKEGIGEATRDKTKSVFNLLWISVKSALQKTIM